jgi:putative glycosyltransferase (TIGR04348 family)
LPLVVALTGTDLYNDIRTSAEAQQALEWATRLVVLQPKGVEELTTSLQHKTRVIYQSAARPNRQLAKSRTTFDICVLGHLRPVKDPFRAATAARFLPRESRCRVVHVGKALSDNMAERAQAEAAGNPRYRWLGELPRWRALQVLGRSHVLVLSSVMEGGANVISEALVASVPVLASHIAGSIGLLGEDYPGYFPVADTLALTRLLSRVETDKAFYNELTVRGMQRAALFHPDREREAWKQLLEELAA